MTLRQARPLRAPGQSHQVRRQRLALRLQAEFASRALSVEGDCVQRDQPGGQLQNGFRPKTHMLGGQRVVLVEFSEGFVEGWCTDGHLFHVLAEESTLRVKDGHEPLRLRPGVSGILPGESRPRAGSKSPQASASR